MSNPFDTMPLPEASDQDIAKWYRDNAETLYNILINLEYGE